MSKKGKKEGLVSPRLEPTALAWEVLLFATFSLLSWRGVRHQVTWEKKLFFTIIFFSSGFGTRKAVNFTFQPKKYKFQIYP